MKSFENKSISQYQMVIGYRMERLADPIVRVA